MVIRQSLLKKYNIERDPRFVRAGREALIIALLFVADTIWVFGFAIWGTTTDASHYPHVLGMPLWSALTLLGGIVLYPLSGIVIALKLQRCSLAPYLPEDEERE